MTISNVLDFVKWAVATPLVWILFLFLLYSAVRVVSLAWKRPVHLPPKRKGNNHGIKF